MYASWKEMAKMALGLLIGNLILAVIFAIIFSS